MPFGDGTGPTGGGPRTGRGAGNCAGQSSTRRFRGRGFFRGFGGLGYAPHQEHTWLENQAKSLQTALQSIIERLDTLKDK